MRNHRLFAAGLAAALMLGTAAPALAAPAKAKAWGHVNKAKPKPAQPKSKQGVNGGGVTANGAEFSVMVREGRKHGHFNYTSDTLKVRCKGLDGDDYTPVMYVTAGDPAGTVAAECVRFGPGRTRTPIWVEATFFDRVNGDDSTVSPSTTSAVKDGATINFFSDSARQTPYAASPAAPGDSGDLRSGDVKVR